MLTPEDEGQGGAQMAELTPGVIAEMREIESQWNAIQANPDLPRRRLIMDGLERQLSAKLFDNSDALLSAAERVQELELTIVTARRMFRQRADPVDIRGGLMRISIDEEKYPEGREQPDE